MRTLIALTFFFSIYAYSQTKQEIQEASKKLKMDYGDQQLLMRDVCRKPIEYLETRYSDVPKDKLLKMKEKCDK